MPTTQITMTDVYQEITVGAGGYVIIQASTAVTLYIDAAAKPADTDPGIHLRPDKDGQVFASGGLAGKKIWARRGKGFADAALVVATW